MKFIDFFAGIGGFRLGLEMAGHECVGFCEFDKFAVASYTAMHLATPEQLEYLAGLSENQRKKEIAKEEYRNGEWFRPDITGISADEIPKADCWCFGFPCQDISVAGKQSGFSGKRSSLFFAVTSLIRQLEEKDRPSYLLVENVKNLLSVNGGFDFLKLLIELDEIGFDCEWQLLNSADYVPQNRERVFIVGHFRGRSTSQVFPIEGTDGKNSVSIIGHREGYRQNLQTFHPDGITETLSTCQGGGREHHVALPIMKVGNVNPSGKGVNGNVYSSEGICPTLTTNKGEGSKIAMPVLVGGIGEKNFGQQFRQGNRVYDATATAMCLNAQPVGNTGGNSYLYAIPVLTPDRVNKRQNGRRLKENGEPMFTLTSQDRHGVMVDVADGIKIKEATKKGYTTAEMGDSVNLSSTNSKTRRGRVGKGVANTLVTNCNQGVIVHVSETLSVYAIWVEKYNKYMAIRRLIPLECFRLQGFLDEYFRRAALVNSDSQLYKEAGNSVTVPVIYEIAKRMEIRG